MLEADRQRRAEHTARVGQARQLYREAAKKFERFPSGAHWQLLKLAMGNFQRAHFGYEPRDMHDCPTCGELGFSTEEGA